MTTTTLNKIKTTNKWADSFVTERTPFVASNTFGEWVKDLYIVYSFGHHFPMFVWDDKAGAWFENIDKYSRTTSKQQGQLRPNAHVEYKLETEEIKGLVSAGGLAEWTIQKAQKM